MSETDFEQRNADTQRRPRQGVAWLILAWGRLVLGLALAGEGGMLYAHARMQQGGPPLWIGVTAVLIGAVLSLSGICSIYARTRPVEITTADGMPAQPDPGIPMLGALLVYKYQALTEQQLERALEQQRKEGPNNRRIGEILVDMGLISAADLQTALEHQRSLSPRRSEANDDQDQSRADQEPVAASPETG